MIFPNPVRFVKALVRTLKKLLCGDDVIASKWLTSQRNWMCRRCPERVGGQCRKCTCFINLKVLLADERCPIGKW